MKKLIVVAVLATLTGCTATKVNVTPSPISGSKADGTVVMGYMESSNYLAPTTSVVDWAIGDKLAEKKCTSWGYNKTERFGDFESRTCKKSQLNSWTGNLDCISSLVTVTYQCMD